MNGLSSRSKVCPQTCLLDHLVGTQKRLRNDKPERLRRLEIDDEFEFGWLLDG
jgi:hypothetical protein